ncbi:uncharacterized protein TRIVIDRAFT_200708 [Trichoderma virens Gv29-8]|uniref:DNA damage-inducible protein 1 n=1 Tax=Hypocrea virens (strain Gv29-8 / FGSC 10586) TaxID=413071 RepID=G9MTN5_HYPVG|nr:uncharacterized protein TRIVIDRAFT_200708 [Trichoderma virens Gv29-8]EHK22386.1 hypothetical protein TRIVIDRAFT_200708 [Trichoderma virens Gv29-8]
MPSQHLPSTQGTNKLRLAFYTQPLPSPPAISIESIRYQRTNGSPAIRTVAVYSTALPAYPNMRITLNVFNPHGGDQDSLVTLEVFPDMTVSTLRESVLSEAGIPPTSQHIYHNGRLISDDAKTMEQLQIGDGDMLAVHVRDMRGSTGPPESAGRPPAAARQQQSAAATPPVGAENDTEMLRLQILGDPAVRQQLSRQHPELAAAIEDPARFRRIFLDSQDRERREREMRQREIERLNEDPFNVENQRRIEEMIRQERVMENLQNAMEHNPEGQEISFLGEAEIPKEEEAIVQEPTIPGPAGTAIGQRSGAVMPAEEAPSQTPSNPTPGAPPPQAQAQARPPQPAAPSAGVTPAHIDSLMAMGATREQAIQALQAAEDNVDMAASLIFF